MTKAVREAERNEAIEHLRKLLKPGDTVYTVLRHVSRSGMTRGIDCYILTIEEERVTVPCTCDNCAVCKGEKVICGVCRMCTRCHEHLPNCVGCGHRETRQVARPMWITAYVGKAIDSPQPIDYWRKSLGLKVGGCGMDMGYHVVDSLSWALFKGSYKLQHQWL